MGIYIYINIQSYKKNSTWKLKAEESETTKNFEPKFIYFFFKDN